MILYFNLLFAKKYNLMVSYNMNFKKGDFWIEFISDGFEQKSTSG